DGGAQDGRIEGDPQGRAGDGGRDRVRAGTARSQAGGGDVQAERGVWGVVEQVEQVGAGDQDPGADRGEAVEDDPVVGEGLVEDGQASRSWRAEKDTGVVAGHGDLAGRQVVARGGQFGGRDDGRPGGRAGADQGEGAGGEAVAVGCGERQAGLVGLEQDARQQREGLLARGGGADLGDGRGEGGRVHDAGGPFGRSGGRGGERGAQFPGDGLGPPGAFAQRRHVPV